MNQQVNVTVEIVEAGTSTARDTYAYDGGDTPTPQRDDVVADTQAIELGSSLLAPGLLMPLAG